MNWLLAGLVAALVLTVALALAVARGRRRRPAPEDPYGRPPVRLRRLTRDDWGFTEWQD